MTKTAVYMKTPNGIWVRAIACTAQGTITLQHQPLLTHALGRTRVASLTSPPIYEPYSPSSERIASPWTVGAAISMDEAPLAQVLQEAGGNKAESLINGIMRHATGLFASGFGEDEQEVMGWFKDPASLEFIDDGMSYKVTQSYEPLKFLAYGKVVLSRRGDGAIDCHFMIGDTPMNVEVTHKPHEWALLATAPHIE